MNRLSATQYENSLNASALPAGEANMTHRGKRRESVRWKALEFPESHLAAIMRTPPAAHRVYPVRERIPPRTDVRKLRQYFNHRTKTPVSLSELTLALHSAVCQIIFS